MMRWLPFGKKRPFLEAEAEEWQIETWQWLLQHLGPLRGQDQAPILHKEPLAYEEVKMTQRSYK